LPDLFLSFQLHYFAYGQLPCSNLTMTVDPNVSPCGSAMPILIGQQTRLCNIAISTGNSIYFAFDLLNNAFLNDLQFGISVQAKNATSLDPSNFISVYITKGSCPSQYCPNAQNAFNPLCGYDRFLDYNSVSSVSTPLDALFRNSVDGVYYIQVTGPTQGSLGAVTILFDIEIDDGPEVLARFVSVISITLFCFVFGTIIVFIFFWKKTHGGWKEEPEELPKEVIVVPDRPRTISTHNLLQRRDSQNSTLQSNGSMVRLDSVVNLFREQTAAISRFSESGINDLDIKEEIAPREMKKNSVVVAEEVSSSESETEKKE